MTGFFEGVGFALLWAPISHCFGLGSLVVLSVVALLFLVLRCRRSKQQETTTCEGQVSPGFEPLAEAFKQSFVDGEEQGAAFAVYHKGQLVVDLWGGYADLDSLRLRTADSTSMVYSTTKGVSAICLAHLWDRGLFDYEDLVTKYWSEFGQNNKSHVTIRTLVSHRAGLFAVREPHTFFDIKDDQEKMERLLAAQRPFWEPGTGQAYHALTFGLYVDQLIRRIDPKGRQLNKYFEEEIAKPFDLDFVIGERKEDFHRSCRQIPLKITWRSFITKVIPGLLEFLVAVAGSLVKYRTVYFKYLIGNPIDWKPGRVNDPEFRTIPCGSSHGFGTARALAKLMGILSNGGKLGEKVLLTPKTIELLGTPFSEDDDRFVLRRMTFGPGTMLIPLSQALSPEQHTAQKESYIFGHPGSGGQTAYCDPQENLGWSYLTNFENKWVLSQLDPRYMELQKVLYRCIENLKKKK